MSGISPEKFKKKEGTIVSDVGGTLLFMDAPLSRHKEAAAKGEWQPVLLSELNESKFMRVADGILLGDGQNFFHYRLNDSLVDALKAAHESGYKVDIRTAGEPDEQAKIMKLLGAPAVLTRISKKGDDIPGNVVAVVDDQPKSDFPRHCLLKNPEAKHFDPTDVDNLAKALGIEVKDRFDIDL